MILCDFRHLIVGYLILCVILENCRVGNLAPCQSLHDSLRFCDAYNALLNGRRDCGDRSYDVPFKQLLERDFA